MKTAHCAQPVPSAAEQQRFLRARAETVIETHMAWLFMTRSVVRKLKKPVRYPYLNFVSVRARGAMCREELRLNRRLTHNVYLGLDVVQWDGRQLHCLPEEQALPGQTVLDWLVRMRRLPQARMLDRLIAQHAVKEADLTALAGTLLRFYRHAPVSALSAAQVTQRRAYEQQRNLELLCGHPWDLDGLDELLAFVRTHQGPARAALARRVQQGRVREGHGDLRPQHVCLMTHPLVIDALEFNPLLRAIDPFEELAGLDLECTVLGAPWLGPRLIALLATALNDAEGAALVPFYRAERALLRARLALAHWFEIPVRQPTRWPLQAQAFLHAALWANRRG